MMPDDAGLQLQQRGREERRVRRGGGQHLCLNLQVPIVCTGAGTVQAEVQRVAQDRVALLATRDADGVGCLSALLEPRIS